MVEAETADSKGYTVSPEFLPAYNFFLYTHTCIYPILHIFTIEIPHSQDTFYQIVKTSSFHQLVYLAKRH